MIQEIKTIREIKNPAGGKYGGVKGRQRGEGEEMFRIVSLSYSILPEASGNCLNR